MGFVARSEAGTGSTAAAPGGPAPVLGATCSAVCPRCCRNSCEIPGHAEGRLQGSPWDRRERNCRRGSVLSCHTMWTGHRGHQLWSNGSPSAPGTGLRTRPAVSASAPPSPGVRGHLRRGPGKACCLQLLSLSLLSKAESSLCYPGELSLRGLPASFCVSSRRPQRGRAGPCRRGGWRETLAQVLTSPALPPPSLHLSSKCLRSGEALAQRLTPGRMRQAARTGHFLPAAARVAHQLDKWDHPPGDLRLSFCPRAPPSRHVGREEPPRDPVPGSLALPTAASPSRPAELPMLHAEFGHMLPVLDGYCPGSMMPEFFHSLGEGLSLRAGGPGSAPSHSSWPCPLTLPLGDSGVDFHVACVGLGELYKH